MKKLIVAAFAALVATSTYAAVSNTPHDFVTSSGTSTMSACQFCHAPHLVVSTNITVDMLWNRNITGTATGNATSDRCFTCHAASTDVYDVNNGDDVGTPRQAVGTIMDLGSNASHPVNVDYAAADTADTDGSLALIDSGSLSAGLLRPGGLVQCTSCHDPHIDSATTKFYATWYTACTNCHAK